MVDFSTKTRKITDEIVHLLEKKHHDYGDSNLERFGLFGIVVRLYDKLSRLENMVTKKTSMKVFTESLRDTLVDIAGYAIQAIYLLEKSSGDKDER